MSAPEVVRPTIVVPTVVRLNNDSDVLSIRALLFGAMVKRAAPLLKHYESDLYHDALWITENLFPGAVLEPMDFDWLIRESGTNIGRSATDALQVSRAGLFLNIALSTTRTGMWVATFTEITHDVVLARATTEVARDA